MAEGSTFRFVIPEIDPIAPPEQVRRVVLCSGKVYYDLLARAAGGRGSKDVAILRVEQLFPFPSKSLTRELARRTATPTWCGARRSPRTWAPGTSWTGASRRFSRGWGSRRSGRDYVGRAEAASPATGLAKTHAAEQAALVSAALGV